MQKLDKRWFDWVEENLGRGCDPKQIFSTLRHKHKFPIPAIKQAMGELFPPDEDTLLTEVSPSINPVSQVDYAAISKVALTQIQKNSNIKKFKTQKLQLYTYENFMTEVECDDVVALINKSLRPSTTTVKNGDTAYRTSSTCDMSLVNNPIISAVNKKICHSLGVREGYSERIQGQKYLVGQEFKQHTDYFQPNTPEFKKYASERGQRTWTFMVYLNNTEQGGATRFVNLKHDFFPKKGMAVIWNNLHPDGSPNADTLHHGMPVEQGEKIIITQWFRDKGQGEMFV